MFSRHFLSRTLWGNLETTEWFVGLNSYYSIGVDLWEN
jgi:hypothetical protein